MRDIAYVFELAMSYELAEITREAVQDEVHSIPLSVVQLGVTAFGQEFGDQAAAGFVIAAELPLIIDADGAWSINEGDHRTRDFPPE
jgi:NAD(P)H-hydrate repair Nnr-like enzyme with NAD(P)H-hydrate dehydratase domain